MLKGRGRDPRSLASPPAHLVRAGLAPASARPPAQAPQRAAMARPEPDYEVVEFPGEQYVNAKLQPPPPPPPRPPTGHPAEAASCGLCGGGGARVRCAECGRRALCASCDDMYHRHPKRRHHQRQALSQSQLRDERPPLPPKVAPPVPPPRRHKVGGDRMSASPKPPPMDHRRATLGPMGLMLAHTQPAPNNQHPQHMHQQMPLHLQTKLTTTAAPNHLGSMPFLPTNVHHPAHVSPVPPNQSQSNTLGPMSAAWSRPRNSLQGFNMHPNMPVPQESWENSEAMAPMQSWGRPLRRGASVLELGMGGGGPPCAGCAHCGPGWRYGSCASLDHPWAAGAGAWPAPCCASPHPPAAHMHHPHAHTPQTPQPYRRADSRAASRAGSRAGSRAASPAMSVRSRTSRRTKHRTPSPPPLPSSDADSESESDSDHEPPKPQEEPDSLGPAPPPPASTWQCEHCTYVNEPGVRVCVICCRTPITTAQPAPKEITDKVERLKITQKETPVSVRIGEETRVDRSVPKSTKPKKERASTGCGPSPPRESMNSTKMNRLVTPTREPIPVYDERRERHDMAVGPSPPRDVRAQISPPQDVHRTLRVSPYRESKEAPKPEPTRHSVSVGPSPPRENSHNTADLSPNNSTVNFQKKSTGTSPRETIIESRTAVSTKVSNTGTSPPPQSISTQTYEVPSSWERSPSVTRSRPRRRFRDDTRRERSHSRHSLSSDTRESERSVRTAGPGGRWEWRERDSSPGGEWDATGAGAGAGSGRLARRASHLDLRRTRPTRRNHFYGSEAASPERQSTTRAISLEALAGVGAEREAVRGLELAQLMAEAERAGFSAAEVQAALAQSPAAPLAWLRARWASLVAGVRAAAARLEPRAAVPERDARAALARHRGNMWPAVTDCVEKQRRQLEGAGVGAAVGGERRARGRVWGSPAGAEDEAAPSRARAEDSSDEFEVPTPAKFRDDDWMYLPPDVDVTDGYEVETVPWTDPQGILSNDVVDEHLSPAVDHTEDIARKLKAFLQHAGVPSIDENLLLKGLLSGNANFESPISNKSPVTDFVQTENDFIDAYNALTRSSPIPNLNNPIIGPESVSEHVPSQNNTQQKNYTNHVELITSKEPTLNTNQQERETHIHQQIPNGTNQLPHTEKGVNDKIERVIDNISENLNAVEKLEPMTSFKPNNKSKIVLITKKATLKSKRSEERNGQSSSNSSNSNIHEDLTQNRTPSKQKIFKKTEEPVRQTKPIEKQAEERPSNLNDMVDNTQKLIQQMKEEINSDINSIDGRTMSHTDTDSSSNDEQESSYSDTEERSSGEISDENEETTSDGEHLSNSERRPTLTQQRTSSEDNDNFEEALDHVEEQLEDFKNANIEMLDSIARSLQEEHVITVEKDKSALDIVPKQDSNNNLFNAVNSFEEIYAELNTGASVANKANTSVSIQIPNNSSGVSIEMGHENKTDINNFHTRVENISHYENIDVFAKQRINVSVLKMVAPTKLLISESERPAYNATLENQEEEQVLNIEEMNNTSESQTYHIENNSADEIINSAPNSDNEPNNIDVENVAHNRSNSVLPQLQLDEFQTVIINDEVENATMRSKSTTPAPENRHTTSEEYVDQYGHNENIPVNSSITTLDFSPINADEDHTSRVNDNVVPEQELSTEIENDDRELQEDNPAIKEGLDRRPSPEKVDTKLSPDKTTARNANLKSNIPKLIKSTNKTNLDKSAPKFVVSKVPIRRASVKQHPAPAPPKSHFGNIQSGHVKQLQTRLFTSKDNVPPESGKDKTPPKSTSSPADVVQVKPSTSTLNKKKPAPPPPARQQELQQVSTSKSSTSSKAKEQYFRETCRTEDEWTESDSEDSQVQIVKPAEETIRPPSPPPPITLRRVSGQMIDLAKVRLPEGSPERQARMLLAEGATESWAQAQLAVQLVGRGAAPPAALLAALECADLDAALAYLHQDCELCASRLPEHEMVSMLRCTHCCCRECARHYFTVQATERSVADCVCPYCKLPDLEALPEDEWLEYFAHLDILLKTLLDPEVHELFQRKLRDRTLARDPNFRWCMECSSGFFVHPKHKKIRCPECRSVSCASCRKAWTANHEGLTCEQYMAWLEDNDPERSVTAIQQHLKDNGLECPRCHFKYSLSRGGCMHFTCTQCKFEFCYGCGKPFTMGARCGLSEYCAKLGLHAHHPRNCLFYLRDKEPHELQTLLQMNNVEFETEAAPGSPSRCPVQLQRETPAGLVDGTCGSDVPPNHAGLCKAHYVEYLARRARRLDPLPVMSLPELLAELRRRALPLPERGPWDSDPVYAGMCAEIVKEKIPLD